MSNRSYGYLYSEATSTTEIARRIRADIKTAKSEGLLPARWAYSVRSRYFSGGSSIDVSVKQCADAWQECDGGVPGSPGHACPTVWCKGRSDPEYAHAAQVHQVLTEEARAAKMTLERIHGAYNHTGSDITTDYFDVNYYGSVSFGR